MRLFTGLVLMMVWFNVTGTGDVSWFVIVPSGVVAIVWEVLT